MKECSSSPLPSCSCLSGRSHYDYWILPDGWVLPSGKACKVLPDCEMYSIYGAGGAVHKKSRLVAVPAEVVEYLNS